MKITIEHEGVTISIDHPEGRMGDRGFFDIHDAMELVGDVLSGSGFAEITINSGFLEKAEEILIEGLSGKKQQKLYRKIAEEKVETSVQLLIENIKDKK